ncbi:MAG: GNAT family N-acetyltransferase [Eubacteriales bacterium]|nr:GNAT family N-acetyltransferase [Eubacteriales bacterium]
MNYIIRECTPADAAGIYCLNKEEMGYDYPLEATQEKIEQLICSKSDKIYVAVLDGAVIGYVHANSYNLIYSSHMKNIMGIAVSAAYQHRGVGHALLCEVEKWARQEQAAGIRLVSGAARISAHEFYRSCGYGHEKDQIHFRKLF